MRSALGTFALTAAAMIAFATNSLLCRAALRSGAIDATSFTAIRLASGALVLVAITWRRRAPDDAGRDGSWGAAIALGQIGRASCRERV